MVEQVQMRAALSPLLRNEVEEVEEAEVGEGGEGEEVDHLIQLKVNLQEEGKKEDEEEPLLIIHY